MKNWTKSAKGAIDLGSIMVGVVVIGILSTVIAASVFLVVPWAQDNAAKNSLNALSTAQESYRLAYDVYGSYAKLVEKSLMQQESKLCATVADNGKTYNAASKSQTGKYFSNSSTAKKPVQVPAGTVTCFGTV